MEQVSTIPCVVLALAGTAAFCVYYQLREKRILYKNYSQKEKEQLCKQGFSSKYVLTQDCIIIGSGIGGLTTGAMLAKEGYKVLVLEQHDVAGGCTHTFKEGGFEFDTGLHYVGGGVGELGRRMLPERKVLDYITNGVLRWAKMDSAFDVAVVPNRDRVEVCEKNQFISKLKGLFPNEHQAIDKHFLYVERVNRLYSIYFILRLLPAWGKKIIGWLFKKRLKLLFQTTQEVLDGITDNVKLKGVLSYMYLNYGEAPAHGSFFVNCVMWNHYSGGSYYPVGGSSTISQNIVPIIEDAGGKVLVRAPVSKLLFNKKNQVVGVEVKGTPIYARKVISSIGATNTFMKLVPKSHSHMVKDELKALENPKIVSETSIASMFVGIDIPESDDGNGILLPNNNTWVFPSWDHCTNWKRFEENSEQMPAVFISFQSAKDPGYSERNGKTKHAASVFAPLPYEDVKPYSANRVKHRGEAYMELKESLKVTLTEIFLKEFPMLKEKIKHVEIGTGVSNEFYLGAHNGAVYGLRHTPERFSQTWLSPKTSIPNLYLSGQDVFTCGIAGAMMGGLICAMAVDRKVGFRARNLLAQE